MTEELQIITVDGGTHVVSVGVQGPPGAAGAAGPGVASGGSTGQYLKKASGTDYDTTWASVSGMEIGGSISGGATQGSVLFAGPSGVLAQDNTNFFFDDTNNRLGVGTASPSYPLHVKSAGSDLQAMFDANSGTRFSGFYLANAGSYKAQFFYDNTSDLVAYTATGAATYLGFSGGSGGNADHLRISEAGLIGVNKVSSFGGQLHVVSGSSTRKGLIVQAAASQTANLTEWQDSAGTALLSVDPSGYLNSSTNVIRTTTNALTFSLGGYGGLRYSGGLYLVSSGGSDELYLSTTFVRIKATNQYTWVPSTALTSNSDTGLARSSAGVVTVTDGASGKGSLLLTAASASTTPLTVKAATSQTANLMEWQDSTATTLSAIDKNGAWVPPSMADGSAANNTVYYSTTASKLVYKDSGGTVNNLY